MHDGDPFDEPPPAPPPPAGAAGGVALALGLGTFVLSLIALGAWARFGPTGWPALETLAAGGAGGLTLASAALAVVTRSGSRASAFAGVAVAALGLVVLGCLAGLILAIRPAPRAPLSELEAREFGALLAQRTMAGDVDFIDGRLDLDGMIGRVGLATAAELHAARTAWVQTQRRGQSLGRELAKATTGGSYSLVRVREREGQWTALMRLVNTDGGFNVHELFLTRGPDGQPSYDDVHMYMGDVRLSAMMTRLVGDPALAKEVNAFGDLLRQGKLQELLAAYAALPRELQRRREVRVLRLFAAARLGDEARYLEAIRELEEIVPPGDAAVALTLFDLHFQRRAFDRCLADLDAIDAVLQGDAFVEALRGQLELQRERPAEGVRLARAAVAREPGLRLGHGVLLDAGLAAGDHTAVRDALTALEAGFHEDWGAVPEDPRFVDFCAGPEFGAWSAARAGQPPGDAPGDRTGAHGTGAEPEAR